MRPSRTCGYPELGSGRPVAACPRRSRGRSERSRDGGAPAGEEEQDWMQEVQGGEEELAGGVVRAGGVSSAWRAWAAAPWARRCLL